MHRVYQTLFGSASAPRDLRGNCYPSCIASILGLPLGDVPHFYSLYEDLAFYNDEIYTQIMAWFKSRGLTIVMWNWRPVKMWRDSEIGSIAIFSGKSPRNDGAHCVVGRVADNEAGWELVHDPHPDATGLDGEPHTMEMIHRRIPVAESDLNECGSLSMGCYRDYLASKYGYEDWKTTQERNRDHG